MKKGTKASGLKFPQWFNMKSSLRITVISSYLLVKSPITYVQWQPQPHSKSRSRLTRALVHSVSHDALCWLRVNIKFSTSPSFPLGLLFSYIGEEAQVPPLSSFPHVQGHQGIGTEIKNNVFYKTVYPMCEEFNYQYNGYYVSSQNIWDGWGC